MIDEKQPNNDKNAKIVRFLELSIRKSLDEETGSRLDERGLYLPPGTGYYSPEDPELRESFESIGFTNKIIGESYIIPYKDHDKILPRFYVVPFDRSNIMLQQPSFGEGLNVYNKYLLDDPTVDKIFVVPSPEDAIIIDKEFNVISSDPDVLSSLVSQKPKSRELHLIVYGGVSDVDRLRAKRYVDKLSNYPRCSAQLTEEEKVLCDVLLDDDSDTRTKYEDMIPELTRGRAREPESYKSLSEMDRCLGHEIVRRCLEGDLMRISLEIEDVARLEEARRYRYLNSSTSKQKDRFIEYIQREDGTRIVQTGFKELDELLGGGLKEQTLYVIGAESSVGKTSLILQIADNVASSNKGEVGVLFFTLEQSRFELMSKSISRYSYMRTRSDVDSREVQRLARTSDDIQYHFNEETDAQKRNVLQAIEDYVSTTPQLYIIESNLDIDPEESNPRRITVEDIKTAIDKHRERVGDDTPVVVFIDYLQILGIAGTGNLSDKQNMDFNMSRLRTIARDCNVSIVAISSLSRSSYGNYVEMESLKESGSIEYSADVIFGLQPYGLKLPYGKDDRTRINTNRTIIRNFGRGDPNETYDPYRERYLSLRIIKQRSGRKGEVFFRNIASFGYFESCDDPGDDGFDDTEY